MQESSSDTRDSELTQPNVQSDASSDVYTESSFLVIDRQVGFHVAFHLPCGQVQERTYVTLPTYGVLWKQVHEWLEHGAFSISLDEVVLTNKNAVSELKEVLGDQHQVSQPSVQLKVAWLPPASSQPEASEQEAAAAETQAPQKEPPRRGAAQLSSLGSLLAGVGLIGALAAMFGLHKVQLQHARTNHEQAVKQNQLLEKSLSESVQNNRALTHKNSQLQDQKEEKEAMIKELLQRKRIDALGQTVKRYQEVDLLFMVDCTGSMQPYINQVKRTIRSMSDRLRSTYPQLKLQMGFLGYRDISDSPQFEVLDLTQDVTAFEGFVARVAATGGDDPAEDVAGALRLAAGCKWSKHVRVLFHIADAPCHGREYHGAEVKDNRLEGVGISIPEQLLRLRLLRVDYYFGRIKEHTDKMVKVFNDHSKQPLDTEPYIKMVSIENPLHVQEAVVQSVCTSIDLSSASEPSKELELVLSTDEPEWHLLESRDRCQGRRLAWDHHRSAADCASSIREAHARASVVEFVVHSQPFARGISRQCFWGIYRRLKAKKGWHRAVFKQFRRGGCYDDFEVEVEKALVADFFARKFNKACNPKRAIRFLIPDIIEEKQGKGTYFVEPVLPVRQFLKYSDNKACWNPKVYDPVLGDFCKWTYRYSKGKFMVVDLQGVLTDDGFCLTDPAILHSDLRKFGSTNTGPEFMEQTLNSIPRQPSRL